MVAAEDEAIGKIIAAIEATGRRKNTLFVFSSDNGGPAPGRVTSNGPLRAGKGTLYEGGVRVCALASWDGHITAGSVVNVPLHMVDWYPTLLRLAGAKLEQALPIDGRDAWAAITAGAPSPHDAILLNSTPVGGAIRVGDWKLVLNGQVADSDDGDGGAAAGKAKAKAGKKREAAEATGGVELFNLARDPYEKTNLAATEPDKVRALRARYDAYAREAVPPKARPAGAGYKAPKVWGEAQ
jgi:arylsulfatase A-like enzyme